nr:hypothetical protein [Actinomyces sp.]
MSLAPLAAPTVGTTVYEARSDTRWAGVSSRSGTTMTSTTGTLGWSTDLLRPGRPHTVALRLYATARASQATVTAVIQGHAHVITPGRWVTVRQEVDTTRPVRVDVSGVASADVTVTVTTPDTVPADPVPADVLALDAWLPVPTAALRWDTGRWDRAAWQTTRAVPGTLVWDAGAWDATYWEDQTLTECWTPVLGPCTRLSASRGVDATGPVLAAQAGTLAVTATDDLSPRALGMAWGTPVRLYHWPTSTLIWSGWVTDLSTTPAKTGRGSTTVTASDAVARLVAVTRYGARPEGGRTETWRQRLARLMTSAPSGLTYTVRSSSDAPVCPTVWETDLASHLDALVATTGGAWAVTRDGRVEVWATLPDQAPALTLTDEPTTPGPGEEVVYYTAGPSTWRASTVIASVEATTHDAAPDEQGQWRAADTTLTVTDPTVAAAWGGTSVRVDLMTPSDTASIQAAALRLLRRASAAPLLEQATYWPVSARTRASQQARAMAHAAALDPLTPATGVARGERTQALIARVIHDITPTTWRTDLDLTTRKET